MGGRFKLGCPSISVPKWTSPPIGKARVYSQGFVLEVGGVTEENAGLYICNGEDDNKQPFTSITTVFIGST